MVEVLVILDGASEPLTRRPTSLEQADTPILDALARTGELTCVRTVPAHLPPGSEAAIPVLLGWTPPAPLGRGPIEAAARSIDVPSGAQAWRVDVHHDGRRAGAALTAAAANALARRTARHTVHRIGGHRLLLVGPPPLPPVARGLGLRAWPEGAAVPARLDRATVVIGAQGAAVGIGALMGAAVVVPDGATGGPDSALRAKAAAAREAIADGAERVIVHVGGPDEAAHQRDRAAKVASIERADRDVVAVLADAVRRADGVLRVCPDHGCDPTTGQHDADPVPHLTWIPGFRVPAPPDRRDRPAGGRAADEGAGHEAVRFTERAVVDRPIVDLTVAPEPAVS